MAGLLCALLPSTVLTGWIGLACPAIGLSFGTDDDETTLRRLAAQSQIADLTWEAPANLTAKHADAFQTAILAANAAATEHAETASAGTPGHLVASLVGQLRRVRVLQRTGLTQFPPVKAQQWVIASFEHQPARTPLPHPTFKTS